MDKDVGPACVKYSPVDTLLLEHKQGQAQGEQDARLKVIPWRGVKGGTRDPTFRPRPTFHRRSIRGELLETENHTARAVPSDHQDFAQRIVGRIVGPSEGSRLQSQRFQFGYYTPSTSILNVAQGCWA
jgi:hypothetical protein